MARLDDFPHFSLFQPGPSVSIGAWAKCGISLTPGLQHESRNSHLTVICGAHRGSLKTSTSRRRDVGRRALGFTELRVPAPILEWAISKAGNTVRPTGLVNERRLAPVLGD